MFSQGLIKNLSNTHEQFFLITKVSFLSLISLTPARKQCPRRAPAAVPPAFNPGRFGVRRRVRRLVPEDLAHRAGVGQVGAVLGDVGHGEDVQVGGRGGGAGRVVAASDAVDGLQAGRGRVGGHADAQREDAARAGHVVDGDEEGGVGPAEGSHRRRELKP